MIENIVIARSKSPLLIGIGTDDEFLAASDPLAISQLTNEFIFLEDGDVAELTSNNSYTIFMMILNKRLVEKLHKLIFQIKRPQKVNINTSWKKKSMNNLMQY